MKMYHGTTFDFSLQDPNPKLSFGSYVSPFIWAARLFAVRWSSNDVLDVDPNRPGEVLRFRGKAPLGSRIFIYEVNAEPHQIVKASTNSGKFYPYVYTTKDDLYALLVERHNDWREFLPFTEDEDNWLR